MNARIAALLVLVLTGAFSPPSRAQPAKLTPEEEKRADMRIPELDRSALEPEKRTPTDVGEGERNPFGLLSVPPAEEEEEVKIQVETEEMKIRRVLGNTRVTGLAGEPGSYRVLVGTMPLAEGEMMPRLFANQSEVLRVDRITDRQIFISFVENKRDATVPPRTLALGIDLEPRVRSVLPGELFTNVVTFNDKGAPSLQPIKTETVDSMTKQFEENNLTEALIDHRRALLGESYGPPKNETPAPTPGE